MYLVTPVWPWPWPWLYDLHTTRWPSYSEDIPATLNWNFWSLNRQTDIQTPSASCHQTASRLNWAPSSWCEYQPALFLIHFTALFLSAPVWFLSALLLLHTASTAHTCTDTTVWHYSASSWHPTWTKTKTHIADVITGIYGSLMLNITTKSFFENGSNTMHVQLLYLKRN